MNILLVDNGTLHLDELKKSISKHKTVTIHRDEIGSVKPQNFDLIILSGSSNNAVANNAYLYLEEINLIKSTNKPLIGICMGFEVIAYTYKATLKELPYKESGMVEIVVTGNDPIFENRKFIHAPENHKWTVTKLEEPLVELAISKNGVEVLKHRNKCIYGFQFHPEIISEDNSGNVIFNNLLNRIEQMQNLDKN